MILVLMLTVCAFSAWAVTPIQELMHSYQDARGSRHIVAQGSVMNMVRPMLKRYPIAPLAPKVEEMALIKMSKADKAVRQQFALDLTRAVESYVSTGKSQMPDGLVDTYVHLLEDGLIDELVVFNPESMILYAMKGIFTPEELQKIPKNP